MPDEHARLSPSASKRWLNCPASVRMGDTVPRTTSSYAEEGTAAHALGEITARYIVQGKTSEDEYTAELAAWHDEWDVTVSSESFLEMSEHVETYVELIIERRDATPMSQVLLEQRLPTGIPMCWGTSDVVIVSPTHVEIIDLKYGAGVSVSAYENPQLMLYGVGALDTYGDLLGETHTVTMTIFQPRMDNVSTFEMDAADLRAWRESIRPIAEEALSGTSTRFGPGEETCRWCPVAGTCRARVEWATRQDFATHPDTLTLDEMGELLGQVSGIRGWLKAFEEAALTMAYGERKTIPGWKVVLSGGTRFITDTETALDRFEDAGLERQQVLKPPVTELKGLGDLEKVLKTLPKIKPEGATRSRAQRLEDVLPGLIGRTEGRPSLVPADDARPDLDPATAAAADFTEED